MGNVLSIELFEWPTIGTIGMEPSGKRTLKSYKIHHSVSFSGGDNLAYSNQILAGIFKRTCLDSLNSNNEHKNSLFPLTKSNCFLNILRIL